MMPEEYEFHLEKMGLTTRELELTRDMPNAVAYGYLRAARKSNGGKRIDERIA